LKVTRTVAFHQHVPDKHVAKVLERRLDLRRGGVVGQGRGGLSVPGQGEGAARWRAAHGEGLHFVVAVLAVGEAVAHVKGVRVGSLSKQGVAGPRLDDSALDQAVAHAPSPVDRHAVFGNAG
jgi:hypothetical protein